jgi:hypothetical protein
MLTGAMVMMATVRLNEPDIWWHLKNAEHLLALHAFPSTDTYSYTATGTRWIDHAWLSELPYYLAYKAWGLRGIFSVYLWVHVAIFAGVYLLAILRSGRAKDAILATFAGVMFSLANMGPRTLIFGWLCFVVLLLLLELYDQQKIAHLWWLPPLFLLWINLHGSWIFGFVILGIYLVSGLVLRPWGLLAPMGWSWAKKCHLLGVTLACIPGLFLNPFGYRLPWYPFDLLFVQQLNLQRVDEWRPLSFQSTPGKLIFALAAVLFLSAILRRVPWKPQSLLLLGFCLYLAFAHMRFLFLAGILLPPILAERVRFLGEYEADKDRPWFSQAVIAAMLALAVWQYPSEKSLHDRLAEEYPEAALRFMRQQGVEGRIFNEYLFGGYLIWHAPEYKTFIDGRADIFVYNGVFDDYLKVVDIKQPLEVLDRYSVDWVLIAPRKPLGYVLEHSGRWTMVYADGAAELYRRAK